MLMKKTVVLLTLILTLSACSNDDFSRYYYDDETIYSPTEKIKLSEVILFLSPYVIDGGVKKYIVVDQLKNIQINIAEKTFTGEGSYKIDVDAISDKETISGYQTTKSKISYPTAVNIRKIDSNISTAGEYADLLSNINTLPAGTYICQIQSFYIGDHKVSLPAIFIPLVVDNSVASVNLGEFEIEI